MNEEHIQTNDSASFAMRTNNIRTRNLQQDDIYSSGIHPVIMIASIVAGVSIVVLCFSLFLAWKKGRDKWLYQYKDHQNHSSKNEHKQILPGGSPSGTFPNSSFDQKSPNNSLKKRQLNKNDYNGFSKQHENNLRTPSKELPITESNSPDLEKSRVPEGDASINGSDPTDSNLMGSTMAGTVISDSLAKNYKLDGSSVASLESYSYSLDGYAASIANSSTAYGY